MYDILSYGPSTIRAANNTCLIWLDHRLFHVKNQYNAYMMPLSTLNNGVKNQYNAYVMPLSTLNNGYFLSLSGKNISLSLRIFPNGEVLSRLFLLQHFIILLWIDS